MKLTIWSRGVVKRASIFQILMVALAVGYSFIMPDFPMSYDICATDIAFRFLIGMSIFASGWALMALVYNMEIAKRAKEREWRELKKVKAAIEYGRT